MTKSPILNQKSYNVSNNKIIELGFQFQDKLDEHIKETIELFRGINN
jgi:hypothetical protein